MTNDPNAFLMGGGGRSVAFPAHGASVDGAVVSFEMRQQTAFQTREPMTWPDGNPRMQLVVTLHTALHEDDDDDGMRTLYVKGQMLDAIRKAAQAAGANGLAKDGRLFVRYYGDGEKQKGMNPPKLYQAKYKAPDGMPAGPAGAAGSDEPPPLNDKDAPF